MDNVLNIPSDKARKKGAFFKAFKDLVEGALSFRVFGRLAWQEIKLRYKRSTLGPFWITLSMMIMIYFMDSFFGIGVLSLAIFGKYIDWDAAYLPLLSKIGVVRLWQPVNPEIDIQVVSTDESSNVPLIDQR